MQPLKLIISFILLCVGIPIAAARMEPSPAPEAPPSAGWTIWNGSGSSPRLRARLADVASDAAQHTATIEVEAENVFLHSPVAPSAKLQQGVIRHQVDQCPPVLTIDTHLQFANLSRGMHTITVAVIGARSELLTPEAKLQFKIP